ncbi:MAG TPA: HDOD domain-containing protein [Kineosporiaceae bacterium]|nr:HDOD domain-containing protein [Kineosporiaceae bacterium]
MGSTSSAVRADRTKIGRRSIHDRTGTVVGYELLFRPGPGLSEASAAARDRSTSEVISTAFGEFGLHRLGERRNLYLNATRALITGAIPMPFGPQNVVLEVVEDLLVDAELLAGLVVLKQRGFRLAIDGMVAGPEHAQLLPLVDVVKLDIETAGAELAELAGYVRATVPQAKLMAERVETEVALRQSLAVGFDLLQGSYFERPAATRSAAVSPSQTISLQLLAALSSLDTTVAEVERIVAADPGLGMRILGTVNSASGTGRRITSMTQAIVLLGRRSLSAWVMLAALGGHPDGRRQDMVDILTRARTCELLTSLLVGIESSTAYAVGLMSGVVEVMGADPVRIAKATRLDEEMTAALVHRSGQVGVLLAAIEQFERTGQAGPNTEPSNTERLVAGVPVIATADVARAHLHALGTAIDTIDSILGQPVDSSPLT